MHANNLKIEKEELNSKFETLKINHKFAKLKKKLKATDSMIQSLMFPKDNFNEKKALKWAKKNKYKSKDIKVPLDGKYIHLRLRDPKDFNAYKTVELEDGVKARVATSSVSKFVGEMKLKGFSKFSENIKNDSELPMPLPVEFYILSEGENRDGIITKEDLEESVELWKDLPVIDFHDKSKDPTEHKMSDRKAYTLGNPYLKNINGKLWLVAPGEIINRDMAYQAYVRSKRNKPLEVSAEFGWTKYMDVNNRKPYQKNIRPHLISIVDKGHIEGNKMVLKAS